MLVISTFNETRNSHIFYFRKSLRSTCPLKIPDGDSALKIQCPKWVPFQFEHLRGFPYFIFCNVFRLCTTLWLGITYYYLGPNSEKEKYLLEISGPFILCHPGYIWETIFLLRESLRPSRTIVMAISRSTHPWGYYV